MEQNEKQKQKRFVALTTIDNPFDPINDFREWYMYDSVNLGYNSCQYLARKVDQIQGNKNVSDEEEEAIIEEAIDEIIEEDFLHIYKKKEYFEKEVPV